MSDDAHVLHLFDALLNSPLLPEDPWSSNSWNQIDHFKCVTNQHEHVLFYAVSQDFYSVDYDAYFAVERSYRQRFEQIVNTVASAWGKPRAIIYDLPTQAADTDNEQCLERDIYWRGGLALAYWCRGDSVAYIEIEHQDKELPLFLLLGTRAVHVNKSACNEEGYVG